MSRWIMFFGAVAGLLKVLLPKPTKYKVMEDPDELGYWLVEDDEGV